MAGMFGDAAVYVVATTIKQTNGGGPIRAYVRDPARVVYRERYTGVPELARAFLSPVAAAAACMVGETVERLPVKVDRKAAAT